MAKTEQLKLETTITSSPNTNRETKAFEEGVLVSVSIGKESWKVSLTPQDFGLEEFPANFEPGRRRLLPEDAVIKIDQLEGQARRVINRFSFNYGNLKSRVKFRWIHLSKVGLVNLELKELEKSFWIAVEELIQNYQAHKEKMKTDFPDQWPFLEKAYIAPEAIREKYYFETQFLNVVFPSQMTAVKQYELQQADLAILDRERAERMTAQEMEDYKRRAQAELERTLQETRDKAVKQSQEFVDNAVRQLRGHVVKVFTEITDKIKGKKTLISTNISTLKSTLNEIRRLDFIGNDTAFNAQLERVQKILDSGATFKDENSSLKELDEALQSTVSHINDTETAAIAAAHKTYFGRKLNI